MVKILTFSKDKKKICITSIFQYLQIINYKHQRKTWQVSVAVSKQHFQLTFYFFKVQQV
jgi:hypothetical protein